MDHKLFGIFSGRQLTLIITTAIVAPSALYAAVATTAVSITDPNTGSKGWVDPHHAVYVDDPIAGYRNTPSKIVDIDVVNNGSQCETAYQYTIPSGNGLVITAISGYEAPSNTTDKSSGYFLYDGSNCTGRLLTEHASSVSSSSPSAPIAVDLGVGIAVAPGKTVAVQSASNFGYMHLHGYLVPGSAVPAAGTAEVAYQGNPVSATDVASKMRRH